MAVGAHAMDDKLNEEIRKRLDRSDVVLFMKGTPEYPLCGYSGLVVEILQRRNVSFDTVDVLAEPTLREAVKTYSGWPTFPQLFVRGELVGGSDLVRELDEAGELDDLLR